MWSLAPSGSLSRHLDMATIIVFDHAITALGSTLSQTSPLQYYTNKGKVRDFCICRKKTNMFVLQMGFIIFRQFWKIIGGSIDHFCRTLLKDLKILLLSFVISGL